MSRFLCSTATHVGNQTERETFIKLTLFPFARINIFFFNQNNSATRGHHSGQTGHTLLRDLTVLSLQVELIMSRQSEILPHRLCLDKKMWPSPKCLFGFQ